MPAAFVDAHTPLTVAESKASSDETEIDIGHPVVVCRGKHGGKSGKITVVERAFVRILEDQTNLEVGASALSRKPGH